MLWRELGRMMAVALTDTPVLFLNGARQTGKSTLAHQLIREGWQARYLTLDDATVLGAAKSDPEGFIGRLGSSVVLDEVQRAPELFLAMKASVDRDRRPGRFLLTGSANVLLLPQVADSLAGRMEIFTLWPFSQSELEGRRGPKFLDAAFAGEPPAVTGPESGIWDRVSHGGFPEVCARRDRSRREAWFRSFVTSILERDVRDLANIDGLVQLPRLLSLLAARVGGLVNYADIGRGIGIPQTTLKRYMALLEMTFLVHLLPAWAVNVGVRLVKSPKLYLVDTGLACALLGAGAGELKAGDGPRIGPLLENFVMLELRKLMGWNGRALSLYHFRTHPGQEVDFVIEDSGGQVVGVEVKASATAGTSDFKGLALLRDLLGERFRQGIVLFSGREVVPYGDRMWAVPVPALWN